jgi:hypothetical protein
MQVTKLYDASPEWLKERGLNGRDARRLFAALCALADYEGQVKDALGEAGHSENDHAHVCDALRFLVDGA